MSNWTMDVILAFDLVFRSRPVLVYHPDLDPPILFGGVKYTWLCFAVIVDKTDEMRAQYEKMKKALGDNDAT